MKKSLGYILISIFIISLISCGGGKKQVRDDSGEVGEVKDMYGQGSKTVTAEGLAEVREAGKAEAYERAKEFALTKAIEKALGSIIDARIIASSGVVLEENIYVKKKGYIRKSEVISQKVDDGVAYVTVRAEVGMQELKDDVMALDILQHRMNMPKTIIFVQETYDNKPIKQKTAYNVMVDKFKNKKFTIISPSQVSSEFRKNIEKLYSLMESDENLFISTAGKLGIDVNADIVIVGKAHAQKAVPGKGYLKGSDFKTSQTDTDFKVINVGDGRIIAAANIRDAGAHISEESAGISGIQKTSEKAADELITEIVKEWEDVLNNGNLITLKAQGLSLTEEIKFSKFLKAYYREVKEVYAKQKKDNVSIFSVKFLGTPRDLAKALVTKEIFPYKVDVLKYDFGEVSIKTKKK